MADFEDAGTVSLLGTDADGAPPARPRRPRESRSSIFLLLQSAKSRLAGNKEPVQESSSEEEDDDDDKPAEGGPAGGGKRHNSVYMLLKQATTRLGGAAGTATRGSSARGSSARGPSLASIEEPEDSTRASSARGPSLGSIEEPAEEAQEEEKAPDEGADARPTGEKKPRAGCIWCAAITGIFTGVLGVVLFVALFAFQGRGPAAPCAGRLVPVTYVRRGNRRYAQENTFDAVVAGAAEAGVSPEIDVRALKDGAVVLFHDENMQRVTGVDKDLKDVTLEEALGTPILEDIDGHRYNSTNAIPELQQVVEAVCNVNDTSVGINFGIQAKGAVSATVAALKNSNCTDASRTTIWTTPHANVVTSVSEELKRSGLDNRVALYMSSGKYGPLGLKFLLKTRLLPALFSGASIVGMHKAVFDAEADLVRAWREDGWCVGVGGLTPADVRRYDVESNHVDVDVFIVNEAPVFPDLKDDNYKYEDNSLTSYYVLIGVAVLLVLASVVLIASAWREKTRAPKAAQDENEESESFQSEPVAPL